MAESYEIHFINLYLSVFCILVYFINNLIMADVKVEGNTNRTFNYSGQFDVYLYMKAIVLHRLYKLSSITL